MKLSVFNNLEHSIYGGEGILPFSRNSTWFYLI
jgi:hypothetical protein